MQALNRQPARFNVVHLNGYGFPAVRGGPMYYADKVGLDRVEQAIRRYASQVNGDGWEIAPLLVELAQAGRHFSTSSID